MREDNQLLVLTHLSQLLELVTGSGVSLCHWCLAHAKRSCGGNGCPRENDPELSDQHFYLQPGFGAADAAVWPGPFCADSRGDHFCSISHRKRHQGEQWSNAQLSVNYGDH